MKLNQLLTRIDQQIQNTCTRQEKLAWLSELDGLVKAKILDTHVPPVEAQLPYTTQTPEDTELLIRPPFDGLYLWWLEARIHYVSGEFIRCNNALDLFQTGFRDYAAYYNRVYTPCGPSRFT